MTPPGEARLQLLEPHIDVEEVSENPLPYDKELPGLFAAVASHRDPVYFHDGKEIVDSMPRSALGAISVAYATASTAPGFQPARFWHEHFEIPSYYIAQSEITQAASVEEYSRQMWSALTYHAPEDQGTLLGTRKPTLKPGERFGESYYWDLQDGVSGLLTAAKNDHELERHRKEELALGIADNIAEQIERHGFMPNGLRRYYDGRSQNPALVSIVKSLVGYFGDRKPELVETYLPAIVKEYEWWMRGEAVHRFSDQPYASLRVVHLPKGLLLNRHWDKYDSPRPESYQEDMETAARNPAVHPAITYRNLRAGAESGRDFTARWLTDADRLETIHTTDFATPELNSMLFEYEKFIAEAHKAAGRSVLAEKFQVRFERRREAIDTYLWNEAQGCYYDFDFVNFQQSDIKSVGTAYPVARGAASVEQAKGVAAVLARDLLQRGGLVSTLTESDQQWDMPNGFARDQKEGVQALLVANEKATAAEVIRRWLRTDQEVFRKFGVLFEKNNVVARQALPGGGGEYPVQRGFLWSIGVNTEFRHMLHQT